MLAWKIGLLGRKKVVRFVVDPEGRSSIYASAFSFGKNAVSCTFIYLDALGIIRSLLSVGHSTLFAAFLCWFSA